MDFHHIYEEDLFTYSRGAFSRGTELGTGWPMQAWAAMREMAAR